MGYQKILSSVASLVFLFSAMASIALCADTKGTKIVKIQVKGLTCPFCAYGLEKRLKETGAKNIKIYIDKGLAQSTYPQEKPLDVSELREAVRKGGFTPGSIEVEGIGALDKKEGQWIFVFAGSGDIFIIQKDEHFEKMIKELKNGVTIRIAARIEEIKQEGLGENPPTLKILGLVKQ